jgi:UDP-N-acetylenolpyruvoylglucosamine reductase
VHLEQNVPLAPLTTLRIGGPARYLAKITSEAELLEAVDFARTENLPLFVLGGGSNLLVADAGFNGLVLQIALTGEPVIETTSDTITYTVSASRESAASSASPASPAWLAARPSRTSAPTVRRSPRPSPTSEPSTSKNTNSST